jgi:Tfp pilus assembly protein PilO
MDWKLFAQLLVTFIVAALGWWVGHTFSARRDLANERRKLRVNYLLEAYRKLEGAANPSNPKLKRDQLESAIADIQLLGSPLQVKMASEFARSLADTRSLADNSQSSLDDLLFNLRESLRKELHLEGVNEKIIFLRFFDKT